jgi:chloramphenicol O-acetyltransferase type A
MVSFTVDVTDLYQYVKKHGLSFYYSLIYLSTKAINNVNAFKYTIQDGQLQLLEERIPSFTDMKKGSELFHIVTMPLKESLNEFCLAATEKSHAQDCFINPTAETNDLIYFTCLPWIEMTAMTNERHMNADDAVPRIAWGKYTEMDGRKRLTMSIELNHKFADGIHIGRFHDELAKMIGDLK